MRALGMVLAVVLAGCGSVRYTGTEADMQQVARGTAELIKKDPYSNKVSGAASAAHVVLNATLGQKKEDEPVDWQGAGWQCQGSCFAEFVPPYKPPKPMYGGNQD